MKFENKGKWVRQISESSQKNESWVDIYKYLADIGEERYIKGQKELPRAAIEKLFRKALKDKGLKPSESDIKMALYKYFDEYDYRDESSQKNEDDGDFQETYKDHKILFNWRGKDCYIQNKAGDEVEVVAKSSNATKENLVKAAKAIIDKGNIDFSKKFAYESVQINETRGYKVLVELGVPDNMNNRDIEDEVERLLRSSHKIDVVLDVTAERK